MAVAGIRSKLANCGLLKVSKIDRRVHRKTM